MDQRPLVFKWRHFEPQIIFAAVDLDVCKYMCYICP